MQLLKRNFFIVIRIIAFPNDCSFVRMIFQVTVNTIKTSIQFSCFEPSYFAGFQIRCSHFIPILKTSPRFLQLFFAKSSLDYLLTLDIQYWNLLQRLWNFSFLLRLPNKSSLNNSILKALVKAKVFKFLSLAIYFFERFYEKVSILPIVVWHF